MAVLVQRPQRGIGKRPRRQSTSEQRTKVAILAELVANHVEHLIRQTWLRHQAGGGHGCRACGSRDSGEDQFGSLWR